MAKRGGALVNDATLDFMDIYVRGQGGVFPQAFYKKHPQAHPHDASHVRHWWLRRNVALGCSEEQVRAAQPSNDVRNMRLGDWIKARTPCELP